MMKTQKKIVVLTSGGDAPGMNAAIRALTRNAINQGAEVVGALDGFRGLCEGRFVPLDYDSVAGILDRGGTFLGTSRYPQFQENATQLRAWAQLKKIDADGIVGIGGDGTYRGLLALSDLSIKVVGVPGSIDNDIPLTDFTIGFSTALETIVQALARIRDTMCSHHRFFAVQVMGRGCGDLAAYAGLASGADCVVTKENYVGIDDILSTIRQAREKRGKRHFLAICQENVLSVAELASAVQDRLGIESRFQVLGHIQRGGSPSAYDRVLGALLGEKAVSLLLSGPRGVAVGIQNGEATSHPLKSVLSSQRKLRPELLDAERNLR